MDASFEKWLTIKIYIQIDVIVWDGEPNLYRLLEEKFENKYF